MHSDPTRLPHNDHTKLGDTKNRRFLYENFISASSSYHQVSLAIPLYAVSMLGFIACSFLSILFCSQFLKTMYGLTVDMRLLDVDMRLLAMDLRLLARILGINNSNFFIQLHISARHADPTIASCVDPSSPK